MNTSAKNILSLLAPVLLLTFGFLALRAGIMTNEGGPAITGILCLIIGTTTLYWWLENMLLPPLKRWFRQRRELKAELELYLKDQEAYASWDADDDYEVIDFDNYGPDEDRLTFDNYGSDTDCREDDTDPDLGETCWMTIWWDEEYRRSNVEF